jgi:hypothetical protein
MKNMKRSERRHQQWVVFKRRLKLWGVWYDTDPTDYLYLPSGNRESALKGETHCFLKDTSTPCSCYMCSYPKYERTPKQYIQRDIEEEIRTFEESIDI